MEPIYGTPEGESQREPGAPVDPEEELRARAVQRLERKRAFYRQLGTYLAVNGLLWVIWLVSALGDGTWFPWPIFASLGWGLAIANSARAAFGSDGYSEAQIQAEMRRLDGH